MCVFKMQSSGPECGICGQFAKGTCTVTVGAKSFSSLQSAVNAAANGTTSNPTLIQVRGVCVGSTLVLSRSNLIIEGIAPATQCPPGPNDLTSTLTGPS